MTSRIDLCAWKIHVMEYSNNSRNESIPSVSRGSIYLCRRCDSLTATHGISNHTSTTCTLSLLIVFITPAACSIILQSAGQSIRSNGAPNNHLGSKYIQRCHSNSLSIALSSNSNNSASAHCLHSLCSNVLGICS